jgi:hypothetical protein
MLLTLALQFTLTAQEEGAKSKNKREVEKCRE